MKIYLSKELFDSTKQLIRRMRTTFLLVMVFASSLFATDLKSQVAKVTIAMKNTNLIKVIDANRAISLHNAGGDQAWDYA